MPEPVCDVSLFSNMFRVSISSVFCSTQSLQWWVLFVYPNINNIAEVLLFVGSIVFFLEE